MKTKLSNEIKTLRQEYTDLEKANGEGSWPAEAVKRAGEILEKAEALRSQMDQEAKADAFKQWADLPDGQSAVRSSYNSVGETTPNDGAIEGVTSDKDGYLYPIKGIGEKKLRALSSGAYKDAVNDYLRSKGLGRSMKGGDAEAMKVLQEGLDPAGGFWVPPEYRPELVKKIATITNVRQRARVMQTGSDLMSFPKVNYTTDDKYTAGTRIAWTGEAPASDISESTNPVAGRENIPVHLATCSIIVTRQQLEDNQFDLLGYITEIGGESFGLGEEDVFTNGTGSGQPQGFLTHPQLGTASTSGGMYVPSGVSAQITWQGYSSGSVLGTIDTTKGIIGVEGELPPQYEADATWMASKKSYSAIRGLVDTTGKPLWNQTDGQWANYIRGLPASLLGYQLVKNQFMPAVAANTYPVVFGDFKGYYIVDRVGLSIEVLREVRALRDEVVIYMRKRVGGQLVEYWRMKALKLAAS
jgi:HK97 family phage major capsid protein